MTDDLAQLESAPAEVLGPEPRRAFLLGGVLPALALPVLGAGLYSSTGRDDAYLTYWPAYALAHLGEIVNYNGARLEQSSSLLHTLVLAAGTRATTIDIPTLGYGLGVVGGIATVLLVWLTAWRIVPLGAWMAALLAATSAPIVYWSFSGMETTLVAALLLGTLLSAAQLLRADGPGVRRWILVSGAVVLAFTMVRPEAGPVLFLVFAVLALVSRVLRSRDDEWDARSLHRSLLLLGLAVVAFIVVTAARLLYFGAAFPQPVSAKSVGIQLEEGVDYVAESLRTTSFAGIAVAGVALGVFAVLGIVRIGRRPTPLGVLVATAAIVELGFVIVVGGDWMEAGRFLVPTFALVAVLSAAGLEAVPGRVIVAVALVVLQVGGAVRIAQKSSSGTPVWSAPSITKGAETDQSFSWFERQNRVHLRDTTFIDPLARVIDALQPQVNRPVTIATGQAGMVPYYVFQSEYGRARLIDVRGIASDALSRCPGLEPTGPYGMGYGLDITLSLWIAHERECGVRLPDVIYGLHSFTQMPDDVQAQYRLVHQQRGRAVAHSRFLHGDFIPAREFIAVRKDLAHYFAPTS